MFKDLKVGRKLQVGFGIVIGFNIIAALVTIMGFNRMFNKLDQFYRVPYPSVKAGSPGAYKEDPAGRVPVL